MSGIINDNNHRTGPAKIIKPISIIVNKNINDYVDVKIKKSDIADAAFKKKVTIINGCILLVFTIVGMIAHDRKKKVKPNTNLKNKTQWKKKAFGRKSLKSSLPY